MGDRAIGQSTRQSALLGPGNLGETAVTPKVCSPQGFRDPARIPVSICVCVYVWGPLSVPPVCPPTSVGWAWDAGNLIPSLPLCRVPTARSLDDRVSRALGGRGVPTGSVRVGSSTQSSKSGVSLPPSFTPPKETGGCPKEPTWPFGYLLGLTCPGALNLALSGPSLQIEILTPIHHCSLLPTCRNSGACS